MNDLDYFELLSAYLDGELTSDENQKVEQWLSQDLQAQKTYKYLSQLRYHLQKASAPVSSFSTDQLTEQVISESQQQTWQEVKLWAKRILLVVFVAATSGAFAWRASPSFRLAESQPSETSPASGLMISVDQPILDIPTYPDSTSSHNLEGSFNYY